MQISKSTKVLLFFVFCGWHSIGHSITINLFRVNNNVEGPSTSVGGGSFDGVVRAAADYWQGVFKGQESINISYGWGANSDLGSTNPFTNTITFGKDRSDWFIDPTPYRNEEFTIIDTSTKNLGGGAMNIQRSLSGTSGAIDLYTVALHEIGHALGFKTPGPATLDISDGYVDIKSPLPFAGSRLPSDRISPHFKVSELPDTLMAGAPSKGQRILPSQADIVAIAQFGDYAKTKLGAEILVGGTTVLGDEFSTLQIGFGGRGRMSVDGGGKTTVLDLRIGGGPNSPGSVTITGDGSTVASFQVLVGVYSSGELSILDGGVLRNRAANYTTQIGNQGPGADGTLLVSGAGSLYDFSGGTIQIGGQARGTANISFGGKVITQYTLVSSDGKILVSGSGSEWTSTQAINVGSYSSSKTCCATISVMNGGIVRSPLIIVESGGRIGGNGQIVGDLKLDGGVLLPGASPGVLAIEGNLVLMSGVLELEMEGSMHDQLRVSGEITVGKDFEFDLFLSDLSHIDAQTLDIDLADFFPLSKPRFLDGFLSADIDIFTSDIELVGRTINLYYNDEMMSVISSYGKSSGSILGEERDIPEPSTYAMVLLSLIVLKTTAARKSRSVAAAAAA